MDLKQSARPHFVYVNQFVVVDEFSARTDGCRYAFVEHHQAFIIDVVVGERIAHHLSDKRAIRDSNASNSCGFHQFLCEFGVSLKAKIAQYFGKQYRQNGFVAIAREVRDGVEITANLGGQFRFLEVFGNVVDGNGGFGENLTFIAFDAVWAVCISIFLCQIHPNHGWVDAQTDAGAFGTFYFPFEIDLQWEGFYCV